MGPSNALARRLVASSVVAGALALAGAAPASAIPVRDLRVFGQGENSVVVGARAYSPATADGCGARYNISINAPDDTVVRSRQGRLNVCRGEAGSYTVGVVLQRFNVGDLPVATYTICVAVGQSVNGSMSNHAICRDRRM